MKLYTEHQVRDAIKKSRSIKNKDGDIFDYYFSDDEAIDFLRPIEFPHYEEIHKQAKVVEKYHELMSLEESCASTGRFHGLLHAAHLMCNAAMLTEFYYTHPEFDDRVKYEKNGK